MEAFVIQSHTHLSSKIIIIIIESYHAIVVISLQTKYFADIFGLNTMRFHTNGKTKIIFDVILST